MILFRMFLRSSGREFICMVAPLPFMLVMGTDILEGLTRASKTASFYLKKQTKI